MNDSPPRSVARILASACLDALRRAFQGALFAIWVPPAATFVIVFPSGLYKELAIGKLPITEVLLRSLVGGLGIAGIAFMMGAMALATWGFGVLLLLRMLRIDSPLVASVAAASLTFWRFGVSPSNGRSFSEDPTVIVMFVLVAATTGYVAGAYARINSTLEKDAPNSAHLSI